MEVDLDCETRNKIVHFDIEVMVLKADLEHAT